MLRAVSLMSPPRLSHNATHDRQALVPRFRRPGQRHACGSGTTAVGLLEAFKKKGPVELTIKQPSTMSITIKVSYAGKKFGEAILSGPMEVLTSQEVMTL